MSELSIPIDSPPWHDYTSSSLDAIEAETQRVGEYLFSHLHENRTRIWQRRWWDDQVMAWSMRDESLKTELFRFVDVLPALRTPQAVLDRLQEYLDGVRPRVAWPLRTALRLARHTPGMRALAARLIRRGAADFAQRFISGANPNEAIRAAKQQRDLGRAFTLDLLGEAVITEAEAEAHTRSYLELLETAGPTVNAWPSQPQIDCDSHGELPRLNVSIKLSALDARFDAIDPAGVFNRAGGRLREILRAAARQRAFINVDMESYVKKDLTLHVVKSILSEPEFRERTDIGIVIQCYLRDSARDVVELADWARHRGAPIYVRLVKGAYWDYETIFAQANGRPIPVYQMKRHSDANFERLTRFVMRNAEFLRPAIASHNLRSLAHAIATAKQIGLPPSDFELQMLYGMADAEKQAIVDLGHRLRIYMPLGELIPGMAYLVRRLLENTSNDSFLRAGFVEHRSPQELLRSPGVVDERISARKNAVTKKAVTMKASSSLVNDFENHPTADFARADVRESMQRALDDVRSQLGRYYPLILRGERVETSSHGRSFDPSHFDRVVGTSAQATGEHIDRAVRAARESLESWRRAGVESRAKLLRRAAQEMERRYYELAAWSIYEAGKTWREATGEVDEAIDFLNYYADQALELQGPQGADVPGERNRFDYLPRGVVGVIAPWNFPLAILTGMTAAALAVGNTVVMKPAEQTPIIAAKLMEVLEAAGIPPGVVNYAPGIGETAGAALVEHPLVAMIVFTGSRQVGLAINARAAQLSQRSPNVKRVVAEMGGKNAILVDSDADLDEAVQGVVQSAFGFQGQKCSACSRAIVLNDVYDAFLARLTEAAKTRKLGSAYDPGVDLGPVIDAESRDRIERYIAIGNREGRKVVAIDAGELKQTGYYIGPHVFADVSPKAKIAQEEIFGPVLAVLRAKDFEEALAIANGTEYALTGGVFSRSPLHLDLARREFLVGNLYLNRGITGAMVARQPFGGFKMSGIGSKAGGRDYLLQFVVPRAITENTLRRGFAPMETE